MATYYYNPYSGENYLSQWSRHIQNQSYIEDVNKSVSDNTKQQTREFSGIISRQTSEFNEAIRGASREQVLAVQESTNAVCGDLNAGFELLSDNLQDISYSIDGLRSEVNNMASMLDWRLSLLIERQRITNLLLGNIAVLLRIPDIQKERQYHIEQGIKFLKNAIFDSDFYEDSLNNLLKAERIEQTDFFALHRIGLIYMYSLKHLELNKAEEYFKKAAKYAVAETNAGATVTTNYLTGDLNRNLSEQKPTVDSIKLQAAESYMFAGRSCYIQGKLNEAADYASKGFSLVPQMVEAGFTQAKALAANNNDTQAAIVLEKVINTDRFYSLKTLSDLDLCPKPSIQSLLKKLQKESTEKALNILQHCNQQKISGSNATNYLDKIERLINRNTFLTSKKAIDLFEKVRDWKYCEPFENSKQSDQLNELIGIINSLNKLQYYKAGSNFVSMNAKFIDTFTDKINQETQWIFPLRAETYNNFNWASGIKSNGGDCNVVQFIELEKKLNDDLPKVISNLKNLLQQYLNENTQQLNYLENERIKALNYLENERIKAENERRYADNANLTKSIGWGILGGLAGAVGGLVVGFCVGLIVVIGSCISTGTEKGSEKYSGIIVLSAIVIGGIIGYIKAFMETRKKF
ncbi:MAG: hypothetical protein KJ666_03415 [Bacteroidetes bacterium]|nr:hypothetical protein [Bacteroidota bacterium]